MRYYFSIFLFLYIAALAYGGDTLYEVGSMQGKKLFWENSTNKLDTLGIKSAIGLSADFNISSKSIKEVAKLLRDSGKKVYKINDACAASIAIASELGYRIIVLSQWGSTPDDRLLVSKPGMSLARKKQRIVTDFLWEPLENVSFLPGSGVIEGAYVKLFFKDGGNCSYNGKERIVFLSKEISGTEGFVLTYENEQYAADLVLKRMILGTYLVTDSGQSKQTVERKIGKAMDSKAFDLTYRFQSLISVE